MQKTLTSRWCQLQHCVMTMWQPDLEQWRGPRYRAIADALTLDVREGRLSPGERLPTHRDLAWRLGVTVGTVSRAYEEAERRGLIAGEVGRGTFIRLLDPTTTASDAAERGQGGKAADANDLVDLSLNHPTPGTETALLAETMRQIASSNDLEPLLRYQPHSGRLLDREAGAHWVAQAGIAADPDRLVITGGRQHALANILA